MEDLNKLLDGSVEDVKAGLAGKNHDQLLALQTAEKAGQNRKGALTAIDDAIKVADAERAGGFVVNGNIHVTHSTVAADFDPSGPANIAPADQFDTSGAPQQIVPDVDASHPAVDNDPRAGTTANQNRIDFNDPTKPGHQVVEEALRD
jgi:hypothetical protein